eukprot:TRINITY_DN8120_c0_g1_i25.p1 TRINITY_DN8120_c0_g1~~TRINITY_DN8120_c0_g1_i25.p1  ORF type:complete len:256 (-),score=27.19 TRINITY_DN8120_c0_g1_i25:265-1032(-)
MTELFYGIQGILSGFSFLGSVLIVISACTVPSLRKHPTSLVIYLSLCDTLFSLKYLSVAIWPNSSTFEDKSEHPHLCLLEAAWSQIFGLASVSWNAMISINLVISIANPFVNTSTKEILYHIYVWLLTAITTIVMVLGNHYNPSGDGTCWLHGRDEIGWPLFCLWLVLYQILSVSTLIYVGLRTGNLAKAEEYQFRVLFRMGLYVVIFVATWLGPLGMLVFGHRIKSFQRMKYINFTPVGGEEEELTKSSFPTGT